MSTNVLGARSHSLFHFISFLFPFPFSSFMFTVIFFYFRLLCLFIFSLSFHQFISSLSLYFAFTQDKKVFYQLLYFYTSYFATFYICRAHVIEYIHTLPTQPPIFFIAQFASSGQAILSLEGACSSLELYF